MTLTKRRRGKANSRASVHWSVDPDRDLRTMGSFYLLLHRMMARSRAFSHTASVWWIWAGSGRGGARHAATAGHCGPFDAELARKLKLGAWADRHGLVGDDGAPLEMLVTRVKKTVEARTAKKVGGHLPSARLTNTAQSSFAHYLRADPFITEWAADVLTEAITDAEYHARDVMIRLGGADPKAVSQTARSKAEVGELDPLATSCLDMEHHPAGGRCRSSFLSCFSCPNALVLERHLPALLALADALREDLQQRDAEQWTARHGTTWQILTRDILPRFSPAQHAAADQRKPLLPLDLLDGPKESP